MSQMVKYENRDGVAWLTLDAPARLNALDLDGWNGITAGLQRAAQETRAPVVITGTPRAFCAGDDISTFATLRADRELAEVFFLQGLFGTIEAIVTHPTPVIAAVNGIAYGGGLELVAASDLAVAGSSARFCIPEGRIGAFATVFVGLAAEQLTTKRANAFAYTMQPLDPAEAERLGLINEVVPDDELVAAVDRTVAQVRQGSYDSIVQTKRFLTEHLREHSLPRVRRALRALVDDVLPTGDLAEGTQAFLDKREPEFAS